VESSPYYKENIAINGVHGARKSKAQVNTWQLDGMFTVLGRDVQSEISTVSSHVLLSVRAETVRQSRSQKSTA